jgi:hypothetical protein
MTGVMLTITLILVLLISLNSNAGTYISSEDKGDHTCYLVYGF